MTAFTNVAPILCYRLQMKVIECQLTGRLPPPPATATEILQSSCFDKNWQIFEGFTYPVIAFQIVVRGQFNNLKLHCGFVHIKSFWLVLHKPCHKPIQMQPCNMCIVLTCKLVANLVYIHLVMAVHAAAIKADVCFMLFPSHKRRSTLVFHAQ